jgi:hypothetical protein
LQRSRCRRLCTEIKRLVWLNYPRWKGRRKKNEEEVQIESNALTDEIWRKNEEARSAFVLQKSEIGELSRDFAQGSEQNAAMLRKLALLETELQNTKKNFEAQIHEPPVQLKEAMMRYKYVKAIFVGQSKQIKKEQEPAVAEAKYSRSKSEI